MPTASWAQSNQCRQVYPEEGLVVRSQPNPNSAVRGGVNQGQRVTLAPNWRIQRGPDGRNWLPISAPIAGYISNGFPGSGGNLILCSGGTPTQPSNPAPSQPPATPPTPAPNRGGYRLEPALDGYQRGYVRGDQLCTFNAGSNPPENPFVYSFGNRSGVNPDFVTAFNAAYRVGVDHGYQWCRGNGPRTVLVAAIRDGYAWGYRKGSDFCKFQAGNTPPAAPFGYVYPGDRQTAAYIQQFDMAFRAGFAVGFEDCGR
jgi:hypothetical protein